MILKLEGVSKSYGKKKVVDDLSFEINKPGVFGMLGRNGAGKTTTIRMILGILSKDSGTIEWNGKKVTRENVNFGYLPEERGIYPKTKVEDQLIYFAELKGMDRKKAKEAIKYWAKRLEVSEYLSWQAEKLSKGNQQKIQFMIVLIHDPELIILDEPFSGLDPINAEIIRNIIIDLVKQGKYIILSSHQMNIIEEFCNEILIIDEGKTIINDSLKNLKRSYGKTKLIIETGSKINDYLDSKYFDIVSFKDDVYEIKFTDLDKAYALLKKMLSDEIVINRFEISEPSLREIFVDKVGKDK